MNRRRNLLWLGVGFLLSGPADSESLALVGDRVIDGVADRALSSTVVVIEGEAITAIGGEAVIPSGARRIDLSGTTLLPGLIDAHVHPMIWGDDYQIEHLRRSSAYKALRGLRAVQNCLDAGFTSLRFLGEADVHYGVMDVRHAIDEGWFQGPRLAGAGHYISITGGGGDINFLSPEQHVIADGLVVDGVDEMRKAIRREVKYGSDWIKLLVTGAFMSAGDNPRDVHLSDEELEVAMQEAGRLSVPVMAHAHSAEGIKMAIRAGARSIEHGTFLDEEGVELLLEHGTFLVPTMYIGDYYIDDMADSEAQKKMVELSIRYRDEFFENIGRAIAAGVKVTVGSDFSCENAELNVREFATLVEAGMTPMQAIKAGTSLNAELMGWDNRLGTLEVGKAGLDLACEIGDAVRQIEGVRGLHIMAIGSTALIPELVNRLGLYPRPTL
jgi:imidazolonepropionase-like amidohydrolase